MKYNNFDKMCVDLEEKAVIYEFICQGMKFTANLIDKTLRHVFTYTCIGFLILLVTKSIPMEYLYHILGGFLLAAVCIIRLPSIFNAYYDSIFYGYKKSLCDYFMRKYKPTSDMNDEEKKALLEKMYDVVGVK